MTFFTSVEQDKFVELALKFSQRVKKAKSVSSAVSFALQSFTYCRLAFPFQNNHIKSKARKAYKMSTLMALRKFFEKKAAKSLFFILMRANEKTFPIFK